MENNIIISNLNDFIFCPRSIYFHNIYDSFNDSLYHESYQVEGRNAHESIDSNKYSTTKSWIQGMSVFSEEFGITGKIDLFNTETGVLVERKNKIKKIYDGYFLQIYAQYFCLVEMKFRVKKLQFYSLSDNKKHDVEIPTANDKERLRKTINAMRTFDLHAPFHQNQNKCMMCIYRSLCDYYQNDEQT